MENQEMLEKMKIEHEKVANDHDIEKGKLNIDSKKQDHTHEENVLKVKNDTEKDKQNHEANILTINKQHEAEMVRINIERQNSENASKERIEGNTKNGT